MLDRDDVVFITNMTRIHDMEITESTLFGYTLVQNIKTVCNESRRSTALGHTRNALW